MAQVNYYTNSRVFYMEIEEQGPYVMILPK